MECNNLKHGIAITEKVSGKLIEFVECQTGRVALKVLMGIRHNLNHNEYKAEETIISLCKINKINK